MESCPHPFNAVTLGYVRHDNPTPEAKCLCGQTLGRMTAEQFVDFRKDRFFGETGQDPNLVYDMFYREIQVGTEIVYPTTSGRSTQISAGVVLDINPPPKLSSWQTPPTPAEEAQWAARHRVGEPKKLRIQPVGHDSRWSQHWTGRNGQQAKPVTLTAGAGSAVVVSHG